MRRGILHLFEMIGHECTRNLWTYRSARKYLGLRRCKAVRLGILGTKRDRHLLVMLGSHIPTPKLHLPCCGLGYTSDTKVNRLLFMVLVSKIETPQLLHLSL
jgi:hypothetical protein